MKLTKKQQLELNNILNSLNKVQNFILKKDTIIGHITTLEHGDENTWINKKTNEKMFTFTKEIGNDLCYLYNAKNNLINFIENNK